MSWRFYTRLLTFPWEQLCKSRSISHSRTPPPVHQSVLQSCGPGGLSATSLIFTPRPFSSPTPSPLHYFFRSSFFVVYIPGLPFLCSQYCVCVCLTTLDILSPSGTRKDQIILCWVNHSRTIIIMSSQWDPSLTCPLNQIKNSQLDKDQTLTKRGGGLATKWVHCP